MRLSQCPDCHSINIKFFEARNKYCCNDCGNSFSDEIQEAKKLRIFLSYGHDDNEELVRLIKTDLKNPDTMYGSIKTKLILGVSGGVLTT